MPAPITAFNNFMRATGPAYMTGPEQLINEAQRNCYLLGQLMTDKSSAEMIQSGTKVKDVIMLDTETTFRPFRPNQQVTWPNKQSVTEHEIPWTYGFDVMTWTDQEVEHQAHEGLSVAHVRTQFKRLQHIKETELWTSVFNGMENLIFRTPFGNYDTIEGAGAEAPMPLHAIISESFLGLPAGWSAGNTIAGLSPVAHPTWRPQVVFYDPRKPTRTETLVTSATERQISAPTTIPGSVYNTGNPYYPGSATAVNTVYDLISAFADMYLRLEFKSPKPGTNFFEDSSTRNQLIITSRAGVLQLQRVLRSNNDNMRSYSSLDFVRVEYAGIPVQYVAAMDTCATYAAHSSAVSQTLTGGSPSAPAVASTAATQTESHPNTILQGPRYLWIDSRYICPVIHRRKWMHKQAPRLMENTLGTWVQPVECWWSLFPRSRRRLGTLVPHPASN